MKKLMCSCGERSYGLLDGHDIDEVLEDITFICWFVKGKWEIDVHPEDEEMIDGMDEEELLNRVKDYCEKNEAKMRWQCPSCSEPCRVL